MRYLGPSKIRCPKNWHTPNETDSKENWEKWVREKDATHLYCQMPSKHSLHILCGCILEPTCISISFALLPHTHGCWFKAKKFCKICLDPFNIPNFHKKDVRFHLTYFVFLNFYLTVWNWFCLNSSVDNFYLLYTSKSISSLSQFVR